MTFDHTGTNGCNTAGVQAPDAVTLELALACRSTRFSANVVSESSNSLSHCLQWHVLSDTVCLSS